MPLPQAVHVPDQVTGQTEISLRGFISRLIWLCMAPVIMLAAYLAIDSVRTTQSAHDIEASNLAKNFATAIDHNLGARIGALQMLASSPLLDDPTRWRELYHEALGFRESYGSHVILADSEMHMVFNTRIPFGTVPPMLPQPSGHSAVSNALETRAPAVGDTFFGPIAKEPLIAIAVPAQRDGKVSHILVTVLETKQFQDRLDRISLPPDWYLGVMDGKNDIIARRAPPGFDLDGEAKGGRSFIAKSEISPWRVVLEIPGASYRAPMVAAGAVLVIAVSIATLVGIGGGLLASRRLGRAVNLLARTRTPETPLPDITEIAAVGRRIDASEAARKETEDRFRATFEQAAVGIAHVSPDGGWLRANQRLCGIVGYDLEELLSKTFQDITHPDDLDADLSYVRQMLFGEIQTYSMDKRYLHKGGDIVWINLTVALVRRSDGNPDYFISVVEDINRRKQAEEEVIKLNAELERRVEERTAQLSAANEQLAALTILDGMTGISNRRHFDEVLNAEWRRAARMETPIALLMVDVDNFKLFNDNYGHQKGDECLKQVAAMLGKYAQRAGETAARYGGEEFAIILGGANAGDAADRAESLRRAIEDLAMPHKMSGSGVVTVSIGGTCMIPDATGELSRLVGDADKALYQAKNGGRNRSVVRRCCTSCADNAACRFSRT